MPWPIRRGRTQGLWAQMQHLIGNQALQDAGGCCNHATRGLNGVGTCRPDIAQPVDASKSGAGPLVNLPSPHVGLHSLGVPRSSRHSGRRRKHSALINPRLGRTSRAYPSATLKR